MAMDVDKSLSLALCGRAVYCGGGGGERGGSRGEIGDI